MISYYTALIIQENSDDIRCGALKSFKAGWAGTINHWRDGRLHQELITSEQIYPSKAEAMDAMRAVVERVRAMQL